MAQRRGNSLHETRRENRALIKNIIFKAGSVTRSEIEMKLDLTLPTITTSINEMIEEGFIEDAPFTGERDSGHVGRSPSYVGFRAGALYSLGLELGPYNTRLVLMDLRGNIVRRNERSAAPEVYEDMLRAVSAQVNDILDGVSAETLGKLSGLGAGIPGFINNSTGVVSINPRGDWDGHDLAADLGSMLGIPVIIDNNARMRAVGYELSKADQNMDTFAYLFVSRGVACPLVIGGDILSGHGYGAGELGHMFINVSKGEGGPEVVDELGSESAILRKCREAMKKGELRELSEKEREKGSINIRDIIELQRSGDTIADAIIRDTIEYLGIALANVVNLINPGSVVVDAFIMQDEAYRDLLIQSAEKSFYGINAVDINIIFMPYDPFWGAKGAAYATIEKMFLNS